MHGAERVEHIARWLAIAAALVMVGLASVIVLTEVTGALHELAPSALRRALRLAYGMAFLVPTAAVVFLAALLVRRQAREQTWRSGAALAISIIGGMLLVAGIVNLVPIPSAVFPSERICVFNYDMVLCELRAWPGAPVAIVIGVALILIGAVWNRSQAASRG